MEPYLYVGNNPIMFTDPTGMSKVGGGDPTDPPTGNQETTLPEMVIDRTKNWFQRNFSKDKLKSDWNKIKEKSGWNHAKNYFKTHDFGLPGVALGKEGGSNLHGTQGKTSREVPWIDIEWLLDIIGALKVGPPSTVPGAGDAHTPDTFDNIVKKENINIPNSVNEQEIIEVERKVYWQEDMWNQSPVRGHNAHKVKVYKHQVDSVKMQNKKDSIRATKPRPINYLK